MIYHVFANRSNIGDWLSAKGIQKLLSPLEITELLCDGPFVEETLQRLSTATEKDLIIIGGGGLIMDYFVPFWEGFRLIAQRVPFCIWGVGICHIKRENSLPPASLIENIIVNSRSCYVRDRKTLSFFSQYKLPPASSCPSIAVLDQTQTNGWGLLHVDNYSTAGVEVFEAMDEYGKKYAQKTGRPYYRTNNRISSGSEDKLEAVLNLYRKSDVILSSALHGCIIGAALKKKILAVSGDYKIEGFMSLAGLEKWVLDINEVNKLPEFLKCVSGQQSPDCFLKNIKRRNQDIAAEIKSLITYV